MKTFAVAAIAAFLSTSAFADAGQKDQINYIDDGECTISEVASGMLGSFLSLIAIAHTEEDGESTANALANNATDPACRD